jgi:hypothetical protein
VCEQFVCAAPTAEPADLAAALERRPAAVS